MCCNGTVLQEILVTILPDVRLFNKSSICICTAEKRRFHPARSSCRSSKLTAGVLMKWLEETKEQVPVLQPNCSEQGLGTDLQRVHVSDGFHF